MNQNVFIAIFEIPAEVLPLAFEPVFIADFVPNLALFKVFDVVEEPNLLATIGATALTLGKADPKDDFLAKPDRNFFLESFLAMQYNSVYTYLRLLFLPRFK